MRDPFDEDPFAVPAFDPATGEVIDPEPLAPVVVAAPPLAEAAAAVIATPPADLPAFTAALRDALTWRVVEHAEALHAARPAGGKPTPATVQPELVGLTAARDSLLGVSGAFAQAADVARDALGELVLEVRGTDVEKTGGTRSVRVGESDTGDLKVSVTQPTETVVDAETIRDFIAGQVAVSLTGDHAATDSQTTSLVAAAARQALEMFTLLTSPPKWKITSIEQLVRDLERDPDPGVNAQATRLSSAVVRRPKGSPRTNVEHIERSKR